MNEYKAIRGAGWFGLAGFAFFLIELVLRVGAGSPPLISDAVGHAQFLADNRAIALTWILLDMAMYVSLMVFSPVSGI